MFIEMKEFGKPTLRYSVGRVARHMIDNPAKVNALALTSDLYPAPLRMVLYVRHYYAELEGIEVPDALHVTNGLKMVGASVGGGQSVMFWMERNTYDKYDNALHQDQPLHAGRTYP